MVVQQPSNSATMRVGIVVALSGGQDSMVLLDGLMQSVMCDSAEYARSKSQALQIVCVHVHHGLQSEADAWVDFTQAQVAHYAQQLVVNVSQHTIDYQAIHLHLNLHLADSSVDAAKSTQTVQSNIEARARDGRYRALMQVAQQLHQSGCVKVDILTGHHQLDQVETVLLQLLRGAGVRGLQGMSDAMPIARLFPQLAQQCDYSASQREHIALVRPLLLIHKTMIETYALARSLAWIEDPSNQHVHFRRNAIRQQLLPLLEQIAPGAVQAIAHSQQHIQSWVKWSSQSLMDTMQQLTVRPNWANWCEGVWHCTIDRMRLLALSPELAQEVLREAIHQAGYGFPSVHQMRHLWQQIHQHTSQDWQVALSSGITMIGNLRQVHLVTTAWLKRQSIQDTDINQYTELPVSLTLQAGTQLHIIQVTEGVWQLQCILPEDWPTMQVKFARLCDVTMLGKSLKKAFQQQALPAWLRQWLPVIVIDETVVWHPCLTQFLLKNKNFLFIKEKKAFLSACSLQFIANEKKA
jgi:tRNA(Ile)-lysidine synthetase-like protein